MMLFTPENARLILEGRKTQTRRLVKVGDQIHNWSQPAVEYLDKNLEWRERWRVGKTYAVQPGRTKAIGRIRITAIRRERLHDISEDDAVAEGCVYQRVRMGQFEEIRPARCDFVRLWGSINRKPGTRWADNPSVWVLTFEVVK